VDAASAKSSSTGPITVANQAQSCAKGSRITAFPCRRMRTSSVSSLPERHQGARSLGVRSLFVSGVVIGSRVRDM
jgi:hypothetical protein